MVFIRKHAYVRLILFFISIFITHLFFDYKEEQEFHWMANLSESLFFVTFCTLMNWLWEDNGHKKGTKEDEVGGGTNE